MLKTMTFEQAARWCGYPYSLVSIALAGRIVLPDSEIDVDVDGLDPELVRSMPGHFTDGNSNALVGNQGGCDGQTWR